MLSKPTKAADLARALSEVEIHAKTPADSVGVNDANLPVGLHLKTYSLIQSLFTWRKLAAGAELNLCIIAGPGSRLAFGRRTAQTRQGNNLERTGYGP